MIVVYDGNDGVGLNVTDRSICQAAMQGLRVESISLTKAELQDRPKHHPVTALWQLVEESRRVSSGNWSARSAHCEPEQ